MSDEKLGIESKENKIQQTVIPPWTDDTTTQGQAVIPSMANEAIPQLVPGNEVVYFKRINELMTQRK